MRALAILALALLVAGCGEPHPYRVRNGLAYGPDPVHLMDHYRPIRPEAGLRPVVVFVHGGGWEGGSRTSGKAVAEALCPLGYDVVSIDYRLAPDAVWPAQYDDVQTAVAFVASAAPALGCDPRRMALMGVSAGGHLAAYTYLRSPGPVLCAVTVAGEGDLRVRGKEPIMGQEERLLAQILGDEWEDPAKLADLSPATFARADASLLILHAEGDSNVYVGQGRALEKAQREVGARDTWAVFRPSDEHDHVWQPDTDPGAFDAVRGFLGARLGPQRPKASLDRTFNDVQRTIEAW